MMRVIQLGEMQGESSPQRSSSHINGGPTLAQQQQVNETSPAETGVSELCRVEEASTGLRRRRQKRIHCAYK